MKLTIGKEIYKFEEIIFDKYYLQSRFYPNPEDKIVKFKKGTNTSFFRMSWTSEGKYAGRTINVNSKEVPFEYNKFYDIINQDEVSVLLELLK